MVDENLSVDDEVVESEIEPTTSRYTERLEELKRRCEAAKIEFRHETLEDESFGKVGINSGRDKRWIIAGSEQSVDRILSIEFEKYVFIRGYEAICCYSKGLIEAGIRSSTIPLHIVMRRMFGGSEGPSEIIVSPPDGSTGQPSLRIGRASKEFSIFSRQLGGTRYTLTLTGARAKQNDAAASELTAYADSLFFQIDLLKGFPLTLERERRRVFSPLRKVENSIALTYPTSEYNASAISLYWYARSARGMPLLQFFAFYQSIEFYFPRYSQLEARKRLSSILKDPTFRSDRDDDVDKLLSTIYVSRSGGLGDERAQLRAVVNQCISAEDMRRFLTSDSEREAHYSGKSRTQRYHKVPIANKNADLRNDAADRIYDIRCKIVHTKNDGKDGEIEMLLPFSEDADYLTYDIDLVQFVAKSVLIAASAPIS